MSLVGVVYKKKARKISRFKKKKLNLICENLKVLWELLKRITSVIINMIDKFFFISLLLFLCYTIWMWEKLIFPNHLLSCRKSAKSYSFSLSEPIKKCHLTLILKFIRGKNCLIWKGGWLLSHSLVTKS